MVEVVKRPDSNGVLTLPCGSNLSPESDEWLRVAADSHSPYVRVCQMKAKEGYAEVSVPPIEEQVLLNYQAVADLSSHLDTWLAWHKPSKGKNSCLNAFTKDSSPPTAPTSESNASNSESTEEMVFRIARSCIREALLGSSNSSSRASDSDPNRDYGSGI